MYTRARNSQLYVKRDSSRRSLFVTQGNDVRTLKINDYCLDTCKFHHLPIKQPATVYYCGMNNCHVSWYKIYNLKLNHFIYNCRSKVLFYYIFAFFPLVFSIRKNRYLERILKLLLKLFRQKRIETRRSLSKIFLCKRIRAFRTRDIVKGLSFSCHFHSSLRFISKRILMRMSSWFGHCENATSTFGVTKLSTTPRKNTAVLPTLKYALWYDEGLDERERKWQSTAGITLRFLPHCAVRRRFLPSSRRREYRKGPLSLSFFFLSLSLSLSLSFCFFTVFVFPPVVFSSRLITARRILFPYGENDAAAGHAKGNLEGDTSTVARTSEAVIHSVVSTVNRDYCLPDNLYLHEKWSDSV